ncbi:hypothetical protein D6C89_08579 [Aureobasidium pullulans]|nr:hypothetical protein D6C89_08579 [Aureobasidium pullulans]
MSQPPDVGALRLNDDVEDEYDNIPYEDEDIDYDMDIDLGPTPSKPSAPRPETSESREAALRKELDSVRQINKVIEDVVQSLEKAKGNMDNVNRTVHSASTLLDTWTRILSQTEHNQRLLLNPNWQGATQDIQDMENESFVRQQQAERRAAEDQARREATQRRAEEEERKKAAPPPATRGSRLRGRVGTASSRLTAQLSSASSTSSGYVGVGELAIMSSYDTETVYTSPEYRHAYILLQSYEYWLSYQIGPDSILICEQNLLDMALTTLSNIMLACQLTCTQRTRATQRAKYVELAIWCHRFERHILTRRARTFIAFAADTGVNVAEIEEAWDMDMEDTEAAALEERVVFSTS